MSTGRAGGRGRAGVGGWAGAHGLVPILQILSQSVESLGNNGLVDPIKLLVKSLVPVSRSRTTLEQERVATDQCAARNTLGIISGGTWPQQSEGFALQWHTQAAHAGLTAAQLNLGAC